MSHPRNKRERFLISDCKGRRRSEGYWRTLCAFKSDKERQQFFEKQKQIRRNTTKLCSCEMCGNPRRLRKEVTMQERKQAEKAFD
jgi:hypothetical protein